MSLFSVKFFGLIAAAWIITTPVLADENNDNSLPKIKVTMLLEHEGFLTWYAKENGWDKKLGFEIDLNILDVSGVEIMNQHNSDPKAWNLTSVSSTPLILANNNSSLEVIALANDESISTQVYVRPDSEILKHKGWNADFPNVCGTPDSIAGKTFYVKRLTSSEFVLAKWLEIFNLDFSDIVLIEKPGMDSIDAMDIGSGEGMALWSPDTFDAEKRGYKSVTSARMVEAEIPLMIVVDKDYAEENEEIVAKFLAAYLTAVTAQEGGYKKLVKAYQKFLKSYTGKDYPEDFCLYDLRNHSVFPLEKQLDLFATKGHRRSIIHKLERNITSSLLLFLNESTADRGCSVHKVRNPRNFTDKYLKMAQSYIKQLEK